MITERDYYNMLNTAKADGLAEGREEGLAMERDEETRTADRHYHQIYGIIQGSDS